MHFTPASASWFNMVERFFRDLSEHQLPRGVFTTSLSLSNPSDSTSRTAAPNPESPEPLSRFGAI